MSTLIATEWGISSFVLISKGILFDVYKQYEAYENLEKYDIELNDNYYISGFISVKQGSAEIINRDSKYVLKITGIKNAKYKFSISNGEDKIYRFEYYFDKDGNLVFEKVDNYSK